MSEKPNYKMSSRQARGDDDSIDFKYIIQNYLSYWPLFLVSIGLMLSIAFVVYKISNPVYEVVATVLMKDDSKEKATDEKSALKEIDLVNTSKIVDNEIEVFKSRDLIKSVVDSLDLWVSYKTKEGFTTRDLYDSSPIKFCNTNEKIAFPSQVMDVKILDDKTYELTVGKKNSGIHKFNDTLKSNGANYCISQTNSVQSYVGKVVKVSVDDPESTILYYQNSVDVSMPNKLASIIKLTIADENAKRGADFLNNLIYYYKQAELTEKVNLTKSTVAFIDKRLDSLVVELNAAESKVEGFRSSKGLTDLNAQSQVYLQNVQSNESKINEIDIQQSILHGIEDYVNANDNERNTPSTSGISDPALSNMVQRLIDLQMEKTKLLASLPEKNPAFNPINRQIESTKHNIKETLANIKASLEATKKELLSFRSDSKSSITSLPGQERQLTGLKRQQSIKENLYNYLLQKREEISLSYASSLSKARLLDKAYVLPLKQSKRYVPFVIALMMGLFFPIGFIYLKDIAKDVVNKAKEVETGTAAPVFAEVNYVDLESPLITDSGNKKKNFFLIEQFRYLRTQLNLLNRQGSGAGVTLVLSSIAHEGKSFVSSNLAIAMARSGRKVLLLETDIYKPELSKLFGLTDGPGLSNYLSGKSNLEQIIKNVPSHENLSIICVGSFTDNFSELIEQNSLPQLLTKLKAIYDNIIIDTPPLYSRNDANTLAPYSDNALYIVRSGHTPKSMLSFVRKQYLSEKFPQFQVVFNGPEIKGGRVG